MHTCRGFRIDGTVSGIDGDIEIFVLEIDFECPLVRHDEYSFIELIRTEAHNAVGIIQVQPDERLMRFVSIGIELFRFPRKGLAEPVQVIIRGSNRFDFSADEVGCFHESAKVSSPADPERFPFAKGEIIFY